METPDRFKSFRDASTPGTAATELNTTFDAAMSDASEDDSHDDLLDDLLASPVAEQGSSKHFAASPDHNKRDELMLDDLLQSPIQGKDQQDEQVGTTIMASPTDDTLDDILASPVQVQHDTPKNATAEDTRDDLLASPVHQMFASQSTSSNQQTDLDFKLSVDTSMADDSLYQPELSPSPLVVSPPRPPRPSSQAKFTFNLGSSEPSTKQKRWMHSTRGSWIENPNFRKKGASEQRRSSYLQKRRSSTVPLDCPIAERPTQCWTNRTSTITDSTPSFRSSTVASSRKRKCTVPLDCPIADRPTKSWLAKQGKLDCPRFARNNNKSRRLNPNYLPSSIKSQRIFDGNSTIQSSSAMSTLVFPQKHSLHKYTIPQVVTIADRTTQAWNLKLEDQQVKPNISCPYLVKPGGGTLLTPNGQYSIHGNKRMRFR